MVKASPCNAGGAGSIPGQGARIPHALGPKNQNRKKQKQYCNKFKKDFKNDPHQKKKILKKKEPLRCHDYCHLNNNFMPMNLKPQ